MFTYAIQIIDLNVKTLHKITIRRKNIETLGKIMYNIFRERTPYKDMKLTHSMKYMVLSF